MSFSASQEELPLLKLFTRLREAGLPLGISEYQLLLQALRAGFGTSDQQALADLCQTLWVKSSDDEHLFKYHFEQDFKGSRIISSTIEYEESKSEVDFLPSKQELGDVCVEADELFNGETIPTSISSELIGIEDEIQVAEAVQLSTQRSNEIIENRFAQSDEYFPVTRRQMKQSWRHLRCLVREGLSTELDVEATIEQVVQQGILLEPVLIPPRVNRAELLLLIDQKGSMVPFHALSQRLVETAQRGGRLGKAGVYYFYNCPTGYLYRDPSRQEAEPISEVLTQLHPKRSVVLIFSDAGAARSGFSEKRLELTQTFLDKLKQRVRYIVWLNPMPHNRWIGTTADSIARLTAMYEANRQGMDQAIDVLRGKLVYFQGQLQ